MSRSPFIQLIRRKMQFAKPPLNNTTYKHAFRINMSLMESDSFIHDDLTFDQELEAENDSFLRSIFKSRDGASLTSVVVMSIVISAILLVFIICYLFMRFMHRALAGGVGKDANAYSNVVMHSKRVYEIQAEEGCFPQEEENEETNGTAEEALAAEAQRSSLKRPETGDLKQMRSNDLERGEEDPRMMVRKKERKVHKDSVCGFLFRAQPSPRVV